MAEDDPIFQGNFVKLSESRRLFIGSKSDSWKPKHIVLRRKDDRPVLEYHKKKQKNTKKGERTLTNSFELWPTFKVEKLTNARGRAFVCEITAPDIHQFVSSDLESDIDIFVFLLQSQIRLKENLREDIINVVPDESESQTKIGAKGSSCFLHISPWGITLALAKSRALLAQWPLKSIRYYETSGGGHFTIEAGRVAPMGEGVFGFQTAAGEDDKTYDLVDNYIVNTLDRVKPSQRGTQEEIEDYIREHEFLHSLNMVHARSRSDPEIKNALKQCWDIGKGADHGRESINLQPTPQPSGSSSSASSSTAQMSSLNVTLERSISGQGNSNTFPADARSSKRPPLVDSNRTVSSSSPDGRPPLPGRVAKRSRRRDHSLPRKIDVAQSPPSLPDDATSQTSETVTTQSQTQATRSGARGLSKTPDLNRKRGQNSSSSSPLASSDSVHPPRRHSNPSSVLHQVNANHLTPLSIQTQQDEHHPHTEFYNLQSLDFKVRVSKSPILTRNPNQVGRAEYLLSVQESGVRSPSSPDKSQSNKNSGKWNLQSSTSHCNSEDENQETKKYMEAVARASQKKYGGANSLDRTWVKAKQEGAKERMSLGIESLNPESKSSYINTPSRASGGYVNLNKNEAKKLQDRQSSVESFTSALSRQNSVKNNPSSPPPPHHHRQRSAPVETDLSSSGYRISPLLRKKGGGGGALNTSHEDSGVSLRSRNSQLSSDDGLSRDSAHSIGSYKSAVSRQPSGFSTLDTSESAVTNWLISASCEDLSDHMRHVIFDDNDQKSSENVEEYESTYEEIRNTEDATSNDNASTISNTASDDKPPLPFTGLKKFQNNAANGNGRDRSKSFGYMNLPQPSKGNPTNSVKQPSSAPSAHLIRKMVSARAKQETLRKSLSNPNFLNLGSKEQLFKLKINSRNMGSSSGNLSSNGEKLGTGSKVKSRSFANLFPAIKKALSRESIGHSRSTTPERRSSFSSRRRSSDHDLGLRRQNSLHTPGEMTIKGIRMTARSRSFRRVRETKSVEGLSTMADSDNGKTFSDNESNLPLASPSVTRSSSPSKSRNSTNHSQTTSGTTPPLTSSSTLPNQTDSRRKSTQSTTAQLRPSPSSTSMNATVNQSDTRNSKSNAKVITSSSQSRTTSFSSSAKTTQHTTDVRKSNPSSVPSSASSSVQKSESMPVKSSFESNSSFSANFNITLSSPQNTSSSSLSVSAVETPESSSPSTSSASITVLSSHDNTNTTNIHTNHPGKSTTIPPAPNSQPPPPPPIPPRQKTTSAGRSPNSKSSNEITPTAAPNSSSSTPYSNPSKRQKWGPSNNNTNHHNSNSNKSVTSTHYISPNYVNAQYPSIKTGLKDGSSRDSVHSGRSNRNHSKHSNISSSSNNTTTNMNKQELTQPSNNNDDVDSSSTSTRQFNGEGESSRVSRRRSGFDKVPPKA